MVALRRNFNKFEPISPWIFGIKTASIGEVIIVNDGHTLGYQRFAQFVQMSQCERRVGFSGWLKIAFHADVQLLRAALEPAASARAQIGRLFNFLQAQQRAVEMPRRCLATFRRGNLNVIEARNACIHAKQNSMVPQMRIV